MVSRMQLLLPPNSTEGFVNPMEGEEQLSRWVPDENHEIFKLRVWKN